MSRKEKNVETMLKIFETIEQRNLQRPDPKKLHELFAWEVEFRWPPSLPYGGTTHGLKINSPGWADTWDPFQPTAAERKMDPRVVAANDADEVVILWRQRGVSAAGEKIDTPVLGLYRVHEGKLARAQMFYFDTDATLSFLAKATGLSF